MNTIIESNHKLSLLEKVGYSLGDLAANLIFQTLMTFLAFFYTDVYQIPTGIASVIIFCGGIFGAFFNIVMGFVADRTQTRWGKYRPWILWTSIPFGVIALLAFSTPDFSMTGKAVYASITYILLVVIYSANNLPYAALSGVLTGDMAERNSLSSYRFVAVMVAQFIIQVLLLPIVLMLGDGDKAVGFSKAILYFSIVGVVFFIITFLTTKERVPAPVGETANWRSDLLDLVRNRPWILMLSATILVFVTLALKGGMYIYYFNSYLDAAALSSFLQEIGFSGFIEKLDRLSKSLGFSGLDWPEDPATSGFSLFNAGGIICMIIGIFFSKALADRFGKRDVFIIALGLSTLFIALFIFFPSDAIGLVFISQILHGLFYGVTIPLLWAMIADVADYSEWKNHRRATAIIFSAMIFGLKVGLSLGGSLVAMLLGIFGYDAALDAQTASAATGIKLSVSIFAAIPFLSAMICIMFYEINKQMEIAIERDLFKRRQLTAS